MHINKIINILKENNLFKETNTKDIEIDYISYNSLDIKDNTLFICKGINFKSKYLDESINKGANCYVSETILKKDFPYIIVNDIRKSMAIISKVFFDIANKNLTLIGVTGTKGKTTVLSFIKNILEINEKRKQPYMSTIDYFTGETYGKSHNTTAESVEIYKCINTCKRNNYNYLVLEISSQAEKLNRIYGLKFNIGIFTNIDLDHISPNEHADFEEYLNCKIEFLKKCDTIIIYKDTKYYDYIIDKIKDKKIITYGYKDSDYIVNNIKKEGTSTIFTLNNKDKSYNYKINMIGSFNVLNTCPSLIISDLYNIDYNTRLKGLLNTKVLGRMNIFDGKTTLVVDYAHNNISLNNLIKEIKNNYKDKNIKFVFGCPGDKAVNRRKEMALLANENAKYVYITSEDPGTVNPLDIANEVKSYLNIENEIILDRELAIKTAYNNSNNNDIVLILGKGEENYQLVNNKYISYKSDVTIAKELTIKNKTKQ